MIPIQSSDVTVVLADLHAGNPNPKLSPHFSYLEFIGSNLATTHNIKNIPGDEILQVGVIAAAYLERVRITLGKPLHISSWFRCPTLNMLVGSRPTSQHLAGEAIDFTCSEFGSPLQIAQELIKYKELLEFDQLILEHSWIHISFAIRSGKPRHQVLSLVSHGGYAPGLTDINGTPYN